MGRSVLNKLKLKNIHYWIFLFFVLSANITVNSQEKNVQKSNQEWLQISHRSKLKNNWQWNIDGGFRWKNDFEARSLYYLRSSVGYEFSESIAAGAGFHFVGYLQDDKTTRLEYRPFQDFVITNKHSKFTLGHRFRIEERWFRSTNNDENGLPENFVMRFRYRFLFAIPLLKPKPSKRQLSFIFGNEIFINAGKEIVNNVFDQNRILVSPTYLFNDKLAVTFTYSKQFAGTPIAGTYLNRNLYWVRLSHVFDARK